MAAPKPLAAPVIKTRRPLKLRSWAKPLVSLIGCCPSLSHRHGRFECRGAENPAQGELFAVGGLEDGKSARIDADRSRRNADLEPCPTAQRCGTAAIELNHVVLADLGQSGIGGIEPPHAPATHGA